MKRRSQVNTYHENNLNYGQITMINRHKITYKIVKMIILMIRLTSKRKKEIILRIMATVVKVEMDPNKHNDTER